MTAFSKSGSEKTNILIRSDFFAPLMASMIGFEVSSGRMTTEREDMGRESAVEMRAAEIRLPCSAAGAAGAAGSAGGAACVPQSSA